MLVLGVGGNVSQGILKALRLCSVPCRVIGGCISPLSVGLYTTDKAYISPSASHPGFPDWLTRICRDERVDAVLSGVEPVLRVMANLSEEVRRQTGAVLVVSSPEVLAIGGDKLQTCRWLQKNGMSYPRYADAADPAAVESLAQECGYPLLVKPRVGKGSSGVSIVQNRRELDLWIGRSGSVIEDCLGDEQSEYTVGCFSDREGTVRGAIAMWRELLQGTTYRAVVGEYPAVRTEAVKIVQALKPLGPCNVQLRLAKGVPTCFEVNIRFSGTTAMRARFGFNDVEAALRHYVMGESAVDLPCVTGGVALRYWNEVYVDPAATNALSRTGVLEHPQDGITTVEDYGVMS